MRFNFAIIGGGLTGTTMLYQLVDEVQKKIDQEVLNAVEIIIQIFEKQETFGPGFPHCERNVMPFHITNMCAEDMGIVLNQPADFQKWVVQHRHLFKEFSPWLDDVASTPAPCNHYPRAIMGEYLRAKFKEACQKAQKLGLTVELHSRSEVIDIEEKRDKIHLTVKHPGSGSTFSCVADRVLIATGHWFKKLEGTTYFPSPWPADSLLQKIPEGEKIAVIGTSLSAIEVVLTLSSDGHFNRDDANRLAYEPTANPRRFVLYSRRGLLPKVRGKLGAYRNTYLTRENLNRLIAENQGYVKLDAVFELLSCELKAAYGHRINWQAVLNPTGTPADLLQQYLEDAQNGDGPDGELIWQTVLYQSFDMVREIYLRLSLEEREHFDQEYTSVFFTHAATQPAINAEKMLALMKSELVEVVKLGRDYRWIKNEQKNIYEFIYMDRLGNKRRDAYRYVVNARGQAKSIRTDPASLTQNLLKRGIVQTEEVQQVPYKQIEPHPANHLSKKKYQIYKTGSVWIDPKTHHVIRPTHNKASRLSKTIYAVGAMTRGQIIDASMAHGIVQSTAVIAGDIVDHLKRTAPQTRASSKYQKPINGF